MQYRVFIKDPEYRQLDCQTFKGYAFRRACDFQLSFISDIQVKKEAQKYAKGNTNEEAFIKMQDYLDQSSVKYTRVFVEPYQREKTPEEIEKERLTRVTRSTRQNTTAGSWEYRYEERSDQSLESESEFRYQLNTRRRSRGNRSKHTLEPRPIKIRRGPIFIPFSDLKPETRPRYYPRFLQHTF
ncbi:hypothetical protein GNI_046610 [Gregarina niphandrodes]|uniref:Uncharacterized protein n=1 Tax=Gregarina niphandrodes TaxID=110365 RepID=A0A023B9T3_GRENI|nr:hypothetical protein GNI_046610 [Gregarina niphandrodes]EZG75371.1 hypothetical protein GNI_046610 [Gregarina niphandrodes]|eukprot:XP_011129613.1 hypothetical protein GNI_046610 [Gregarina niphandrodes]